MFAELFPERLRALRQGKGLSLTQLARALNDVPQTYKHARKNTGPQIGSWERGVNIPSYIEMLKLADFFDVSLDFLYGRQYTELELDEMFTSSAELNFDDYHLTSADKTAIYGMIKGYLHAKNKLRGATKVTSELTLLLNENSKKTN